jgi:RNA polymerase sigma-70 factor (ECF subfamily)
VLRAAEVYVQAGPDPSPELVRRAQAGDRAAFDALYHRHVERVYAVCLRMCGSAEWAERLTQDAFVRAWQKLGSYRGESAFSSWLHRLAVNVVLAEARGDRRRTARVENVASPDALETGGAAPDPDAAMDLERAIATLPKGARAVLVLHDIEGYRHEEIAAMLGTAIGTTKAQLHRARRLLRERLAR